MDELDELITLGLEPGMKRLHQLVHVTQHRSFRHGSIPFARDSQSWQQNHLLGFEAGLMLLRCYFSAIDVYESLEQSINTVQVKM